MPLSRWIASRCIRDFGDVANPAVRQRYGALEGWTSIVLNTLLFGLKGALGLYTGSVALLADAFHTLADSVTSLVVVIGFRWAGQPADREHPFGHGRMESIATVVIAVLLAVVGVEMFQSSVRRLIAPPPLVTSWGLVAVLVGAAIVKELLAQFARDLGHLAGSDTLLADFWHHRSDVIATLLVVVAFVGAQWNLIWLDGLMGMGVSGLILWVAFRILYDAVGPLLGQPAPVAMYAEIEALARRIPGVQGVHDIIVHRYGQIYLISLHIEVSDVHSPMDLHDMTTEIEDALAARFPGHAVVHVDPLNRDHPRYAEVEAAIREAAAADRRIASFHDLRLVGGRHRFRIVVDLALAPEVDEAHRPEVVEGLRQRLAERFPRAQTHIDVEPRYTFSPGGPSAG